ncbi:hypothetical protein Trydic_g9233 [Trypoxylus dichotomus]
MLAVTFKIAGDKQFKVPPLAPLKVPKVSIEPNNNLKITVTDLVISGIETAKLEDVVFDFDKKIIKVKLLMDHLNVLANYEIDGRLLVQLRGSGPMNITTKNSHIEYLVNFNTVNKNGKDYMTVDKDKVTLFSEFLHYQLDNLFGNKELSDQTNKILNENFREVGNELSGPVTETIRSIVTNLIKNYLTKIPMDEIFLKE